MTKDLESIIKDFEYIINNANKLSNPNDYLSILSKILRLLSDAEFHEEIEKKRVPFSEIKKYINLDNIIIDGCSTVGNIEITRILDYGEKDVSNVIDIVCKDQQKTIEQKNIIINHCEMKRYKCRFLSSNIYGFKISLNKKELIIPNLYGIYYYIEVDLQDLKLYITIDTAGNLFIRRKGFSYTLYFDNFGLFSLLYKFLRYKATDIKDLEEYENKYIDGIKRIINRGFSKSDFNNLRSSFSEKDIDRIIKNLNEYLKKHSDSVYKKLYEVIEYI
jgi:hypothetical protein